jgi:excisionase family DNA binding protein
MARDLLARQTLTIAEAADALGIDRSTAYALAKDDRLPVPVIRLGRRMVIGRQALARVLDATQRETEGEVGDALA